MSEKSAPTVLSKLFLERNGFIVIGLTGRTGSGCSTAANILESRVPQFPTHHDARVHGDPFFEGFSKKRYNIAKKYSEANWSAFYSIKVSDLISAYLMNISVNEMTDFILSNCRGPLLSRAEVQRMLGNGAFKNNDLRDRFNHFHDYLLNHDGSQKPNANDLRHNFKIYLLSIRRFTQQFKEDMRAVRKDLYISTYQAAGASIRKTGKVSVNYQNEEFNTKTAFHLSETINRVIKLIRSTRKRAFIVIDALRNPYEARYFRDRYSAFYLIAINAPDEDRKQYLTSVHKFNEDQLKEIDKSESGELLFELEKEEGKDIYIKFIEPNVKKCVEIADIHLLNPRAELKNSNVLRAQLAWYFALMLHPGIISPTSMERVMQVAYSAKLNSGCISRQVGAAVTDQDNSVKAVGWNDVPSGQFPCSLRSVSGLLQEFDPQMYSDYERHNERFRGHVSSTFDRLIATDTKGRNISYCFKDLKNKIDSEKNQVHTRSLHAEENAFLQLAKYGGVGINGGKLYTTASPCELCAKKAYQLNIKEIIYIDPYPGIAKEHILAIGTRKPKLSQFRGAVGRGYHSLYEPILPYKDELEFFSH